jgi:hypothetical protein
VAIPRNDLELLRFRSSRSPSTLRAGSRKSGALSRAYHGFQLECVEP